MKFIKLDKEVLPLYNFTLHAILFMIRFRRKKQAWPELSLGLGFINTRFTFLSGYWLDCVGLMGTRVIGPPGNLRSF